MKIQNEMAMKMRPLKSLFLFFLLVFFSCSVWAKVERYGEQLCAQTPGYVCQEISQGQTWASLWPDPIAREKVQKINRLNIRLRPGMKIAVPTDLTPDLLAFAPFPQQASSTGEKYILVDLKQLAWGAYNAEGVLQSWGPASGGKGWCPDVGSACVTPSGEFSIQYKKGAACKSGKFPIPTGGAPMPYCMFFSGGYAVHGSYEVPGYNASHGCVRITPEDARWLNQEFVETPQATNASTGTKVMILGD